MFSGWGPGLSGRVMSGSKRMLGVLAAVLVVGGAGGALLYANKDRLFKGDTAEAAAPQSDLKRFATRSLARLEAPAKLETAPAHVFKTREGQATTLAAFRGKIVVVNLWAMWCAPCRTEMPTLARLAKAYQGKDVVVLPINVDATEDGRADAKSFIDVHEPLPLYTDAEFKLPFLMPGEGKMPQTVILDRQGRIRAHFSGEADWSGPEARALIDHLLAERA